MKVLRWIHYILILAFLTACGSGEGGPIVGIFATSTPTAALPTAQVTLIPAPDAKAAITQYLQAYQKDDFASMYEMLSKSSREAITAEDFAKRHNDALNAMSASSIEFTVNSALLSPYAAEVGYNLLYKTVLAGDIQRDIITRLVIEDGNWKVEWVEGMILPELAGGNSLAMEYSIPARGNIYDRSGNPIVSQAEAFAFGIQTDQIDPEMSGTLVTDLGRLCGYDPEYIKDQIEASGPGWYLPMCEGTREEASRHLRLPLLLPHRTRASGCRLHPFHFPRTIGRIPPSRLQRKREGRTVRHRKMGGGLPRRSTRRNASGGWTRRGNPLHLGTIQSAAR